VRCRGSLTDIGEAVSLTCQLRFTLQKHFLVLIYVRGWVNPRTVVQLEVLGKLKELNHPIGNGSACSILPQSSILPHIYTHVQVVKILHEFHSNSSNSKANMTVN
jgi:hypothetical protein